MFVRVAVETYLVAGISDFGELVWKRFDAVSWCEEGSLDVVFVVQLEQAINTDGSAIDASGDVGRVLRGSIGCVDPVRYGININ